MSWLEKALRVGEEEEKKIFDCGGGGEVERWGGEDERGEERGGN